MASDGELVAEEPGNYCTGLVALHAGYHIQDSQKNIEIPFKIPKNYPFEILISQYQCYVITCVK